MSAVTPIYANNQVIKPFNNRVAMGEGNGYSDNMNERVAKIETRLDGLDTRLNKIDSEIGQLRGAVDNIKYWIIGSVVAVAGLVIAFGAWQGSWFQHSINQSESALQTRLDDQQRSFDQLTAAIERADTRATEANIKAEALRLAQEWQKQPVSPIIEKQ